MPNHLIELFEDEILVNKIRTHLPYLFQYLGLAKKQSDYNINKLKMTLENREAKASNR